MSLKNIENLVCLLLFCENYFFLLKERQSHKQKKINTFKLLSAKRGEITIREKAQEVQKPYDVLFLVFYNNS